MSTHAQLVRLGTLAERYFREDANTTLKLRQFGEAMAQIIAARLREYSDPREGQKDLLERLEDRGAIPRDAARLFHEIRIVGNKATHQGFAEQSAALSALKMAWQLGVWFQRSCGGENTFQPKPFAPPADPQRASAALTAELERLRQQHAESLSAAERAHLIAHEIGKEVFRTFDAVDLYAILQDMTDMKPVGVEPKITFEKLIAELVSVTDDRHRESIRAQIETKLKRRAKLLSDEGRRLYEQAAGEAPEATVKRLADAPVGDLAAWFKDRPKLGPILDWRPDRPGDPIPISEHADHLISADTVFGDQMNRPEDLPRRLHQLGAQQREHGRRVIHRGRPPPRPDTGGFAPDQAHPRPAEVHRSRPASSLGESQVRRNRRLHQRGEGGGSSTPANTSRTAGSSA